MKKMHINLDKATFERVAAGEQDEIYFKYDFYWTSKLVHPRNLHCNTIPQITISNGTGSSQRNLQLKVLKIGITVAKQEWWMRRRKYIV